MTTKIITETNAANIDRVLRLAVKDGTKPKSSTGLVDTKLFSGETELHLTMDPQTNLWSFRYSTNAPVPQPLQGQFTTFSKGYDHATMYFDKRNIKITEVKS